MKTWTAQEVTFLKNNYPMIGRNACAVALGLNPSQIRLKTWSLGLRLDKTSEFWKEFQSRAAKSKVGKKRPDQSLVMKSLHDSGKLAMTPEKRARLCVTATAWIKERGHPRGALGMTHSEESRTKIGKASRRSWKMKTQSDKQARNVKILKTKATNGTLVPPKHGNWKAGWREIGGQRVYFRSRWEANYARFLEWQKSCGGVESWAHEPETFWFEGVKRGVVSYLPDFRVVLSGGRVEYHEVKGWMDPKSKTKIKRMKKYHPSITLVVINSKSYKKLEKTMSMAIEEWEFSSRNSPDRVESRDEQPAVGSFQRRRCPKCGRPMIRAVQPNKVICSENPNCQGIYEESLSSKYPWK